MLKPAWGNNVSSFKNGKKQRWKSPHPAIQPLQPLERVSTAIDVFQKHGTKGFLN
jgi:hypothetical protein